MYEEGSEGNALEASEQARTTYERIVSREVIDANEPGLQDLLDMGIVVYDTHNPGTYAPVPRHHAERRHIQREIASLEKNLRRLRSIPSIMDSFPLPAARWDESGVTFFDNLKDVNRAVTTAQTTVKEELLSAHPLVRSEEVIQRSLGRDVNALKSGIRMRVIYLESARQRVPESKYAAAVTRHGAELRTLSPPFERLIILDHTHVFAAAYDDQLEVIEGAALMITNPYLIRTMRRIFDAQWSRASPWMGGRAEHDAEDVDTVTAPRTRTILRRLSEGVKIELIAAELGISVRTVNKEIQGLYGRLGISGHFALGEWWKTSPDRKLID
ncbi:hypothetical protein ACIOEX_25170 [Streptomyces sp. NPDC087850]|uniref:hypothetical protein n=1 Tax=Streptomyces sp. NPDC087850 TaxID=3365809 RepID=UPI00380407C7